MGIYVAKINPQNCPNRVAQPLSLSRWRPSWFLVPKPRLPVSQTAKAKEFEKGDLIYVWVHENSGGAGVTGRGRIAEFAALEGGFKVRLASLELAIPPTGWSALSYHMEDLPALQSLFRYTLSQTLWLDEEDARPFEDLLPFNGDGPGRNPAWTRDELILALDLYLKSRPSPPGKDSAEIAQLSELLRRIGLTLGASDSTTYRNANGVYMKLMNFRSLDPDYTNGGRVGLKAAGKGDVEVWNEFSGDAGRLSGTAAAIRAAIQDDELSITIAGEPEIVEAIEGRVLTRLHRSRERRPELVAAKKKSVIRETGGLRCEACDTDLLNTYAGFGSAAAEVHHLRPLHTLTHAAKTTLKDLALLCANCHKVVHSSREWLSVDQVRALVRPGTSSEVS
ncbi:hypothetical protein FJ417_03345 [Mesorhizobium sp. B3-1-7]|uniref:HNH endonuclease n=1 Tax=Mesorhizobium sp. B3-1-7 TaxID=2589894 RepID=UPI00112B880A|nr:HNH endonuclease [Mesorhizobium sp. B3-1-7]TPI63951.1 hypothetical protein FJ417_03345 [Mesorhizobium sp. B3-1-7]